jgi:hypothetical protein
MVITANTQLKQNVESKLIKTFKAALNSDKDVVPKKFTNLFLETLLDRVKEDLLLNKLKLKISSINLFKEEDVAFTNLIKTNFSYKSDFLYQYKIYLDLRKLEFVLLSDVEILNLNKEHLFSTMSNRWFFPEELNYEIVDGRCAGIVKNFLYLAATEYKYDDIKLVFSIPINFNKVKDEFHKNVNEVVRAYLTQLLLVLVVSDKRTLCSLMTSQFSDLGGVILEDVNLSSIDKSITFSYSDLVQHPEFIFSSLFEEEFGNLNLYFFNPEDNCDRDRFIVRDGSFLTDNILTDSQRIFIFDKILDELSGYSINSKKDFFILLSKIEVLNLVLGKMKDIKYFCDFHDDLIRKYRSVNTFIILENLESIFEMLALSTELDVDLPRYYWSMDELTGGLTLKNIINRFNFSHYFGMEDGDFLTNDDVVLTAAAAKRYLITRASLRESFDVACTFFNSFTEIATTDDYIIIPEEDVYLFKVCFSEYKKEWNYSSNAPKIKMYVAVKATDDYIRIQRNWFAKKFDSINYSNLFKLDNNIIYIIDSDGVIDSDLIISKALDFCQVTSIALAFANSNLSDKIL